MILVYTFPSAGCHYLPFSNFPYGGIEIIMTSMLLPGSLSISGIDNVVDVMWQALFRLFC